MSDSNVPAVREPEKPAREIARTDVDSWAEVMQPVVWLAERIAGTEFVPKGMRNSPAAVTAAILYGREVNLPPMTALTQTHVIEGKPSMSAEAMRALVIAQGHELVFDEATGAICTMRARRAGSEHWTTLSWTIDAARAAGLTGKDNWKKYPRAMLVARCTADLARMVFPDVIHGFRAVEEMEDVADPDGTADSGSTPAQGSTTKVSRKRTTKKTAAPPKDAQAATQTPGLTGPPLPGEPGFDTPSGDGSGPHAVEPPRSEPDPTSADESDESSQSRGEASSEDGNIEDTSADVVDADLVEDQAAETGEPADDEPAEAPPGEAGAEPSPASPPSGRKPSRPQMRMLMASLTERGIDPNDREERLLVATKILGFEVETFDDLTANNVSLLIDTFARTKNREELWALLDEIDATGGDQS